MFDSSNAESTDPYYPKVWTKSNQSTPEMTDACIGHPNGDWMYHYHIMSPCLFNTNASFTHDVCEMDNECKNDLKNWALDGYSNQKRETLVGVTRDGRPLFGPYSNDGALINC